MMLPSDEYYKKTKRKCVYNIMPISNIDSLVKNGLLSFNAAKSMTHDSIAMSQVQELRNSVVIPNGKALHDYANMYFDYNNPMLYYLKESADKLCILAISCEVMNIEGCVLSDRNAARSLARFYQPLDGVKHIDFNKIFAKYWTNGTNIQNYEHKGIKCAEILVPNKVSYEYIVGSYVLNDNLKHEMEHKGFNKEIVVKSTVFYK